MSLVVWLLIVDWLLRELGPATWWQLTPLERAEVVRRRTTFGRG